jgi:hypothetical protein
MQSANLLKSESRKSEGGGVMCIEGDQGYLGRVLTYSRAIKHEFAVGQISETGAVRAFEIFTAARLGKETG